MKIRASDKRKSTTQHLSGVNLFRLTEMKSEKLEEDFNTNLKNQISVLKAVVKFQNDEIRNLRKLTESLAKRLSEKESENKVCLFQTNILNEEKNNNNRQIINESSVEGSNDFTFRVFQNKGNDETNNNKFTSMNKDYEIIRDYEIIKKAVKYGEGWCLLTIEMKLKNFSKTEALHFREEGGPCEDDSNRKFYFIF